MPVDPDKFDQRCGIIEDLILPPGPFAPGSCRDSRQHPASGMLPDFSAFCLEDDSQSPVDKADDRFDPIDANSAKSQRHPAPTSAVIVVDRLSSPAHDQARGLSSTLALNTGGIDHPGEGRHREAKSPRHTAHIATFGGIWPRDIDPHRGAQPCYGPHTNPMFVFYVASC